MIIIIINKTSQISYFETKTEHLKHTYENWNYFAIFDKAKYFCFKIRLILGSVSQLWNLNFYKISSSPYFRYLHIIQDPYSQKFHKSFTKCRPIP